MCESPFVRVFIFSRIRKADIRDGSGVHYRQISFFKKEEKNKIRKEEKNALGCEEQCWVDGDGENRRWDGI